MSSIYIMYGRADHIKQLLEDAHEQIIWESMTLDDLDELINHLKAVRNETVEVFL